MNMYKSIAMATTLSIAFFGQPSWAQDEVETIDPLELAQLIADRASALGLSIDDVGATLVNLPEDLDGVEGVLNEMIITVEMALAGIDADSDVGKGVITLIRYTTDSRDQWTELCATTNNVRDCGRVDLWEDKVIEAIAAETELDTVRRMARASLNNIKTNRLYVVDDIKLGLIAQALETLNDSIGEMKNIVTDMNTLAVGVDEDVDQRTGN